MLGVHYVASYFLTISIGFVHDELVDSLLKECRKMKEFDHPNVLKLIGVCLDGGPAPYIVMPFMAKGSLLDYLKQNREHLLLDPASSSQDDLVCSVNKLHLHACL